MMRNLLLALIANGAALAANSPKDAIPLFFIANGGQAPPAVRFMAKGSGLTAYFSPGEALFRVAGRSVRMQFEQANPSPRIEGVERLPGHASFLIGAERDWRPDVPLYGAVAYRELYPGIDMLYGGEGRDLKSEFVVAPGADPSRIRVRYAGAGSVRIEEDGALAIPVDGRELREQAPYIYQERSGRRLAVEGRFAVDGDGTVGFQVGDYDVARPLIIDPVLSYSTLLGGSGFDSATALAVDSAGSAYVAGFTESYNFPTANPEQNFNAGGNDVFVAKFNLSGNGLVYCTYVGGSADDRAYGIAVDGNGSAYVTGTTISGNFPVRNALQFHLAGGRNAFVLKLNPAGNTLVYSTYLGGNASDNGNGIAVDAAGDAYVVGDTTSVNFPATGMQRGNHGGQDAFVAKLSADGSRLLYSTYLGGGNDDRGAGIAVDASGSAYITGSTYSADFPQANAFQSHNGGGQDAFIARLAADGNSLLFSTYLGGSGGFAAYPEAGQGIALDSQGSAYVTGVTSSANFPLLGALQTSLLGSLDAFVAKLNASGTLVYSTYLGGPGVGLGNAIAVDASGSAYVVGYSYSTGLPVTAGALQAANAGDCDAFLAKLSPAGDSLAYLSYLGGNSSDTATAVALDTSGNVYVAGWTLSTNFPLLNPYQSTNAGNYGAFVTKIFFGGGPVLSIAASHTGNFTQGQTGAVYTITVANSGNTPTSGVVTVAETLPAGLTLVSMTGTGWACSGSACARSDALAAGAGYPAITVTVNVAANATSPQINSVSVSGGGSASASATDSTTVVTSWAVLSIAASHTGNFTQGQTGATYLLTVTNQTGVSPTSGVVTVTETLPSGLTLVAMTGAGWTCVTNTCTRSDVLAAGASYPAITVTVNVAANATSPQVNSVSVSGGGSASASATDSTTVTAGLSFTPIRVNAGGPAYTDSLAQLWSADTGYQQGGGNSTTASIARTSDPTLYQSEHFSTTGSLTYQFSVPNGSYTANLKFAEIYYTSAGQRVFDIAINGTAVQSHLDIFAAAGGANTAYDAIFPVTVSTGQVTITLTAVTGFPKINAIEIKQTSVTPDFTVAASPSSRSVTVGGNTTSYTITTTAVNGFSGTVSFTASGLPVGATASFSPTTVAGSGSTTMTVNTGSSTPVGTSSLSVTASSGTLSHAAGASLVVTSSSFTPIRVNAGGPAYTDSLAQLWSADTGYQQGGGNSTTASIARTSDPTLYQSEHFSTTGSLTYQFSVPNGSYTANLKFAEIYYTSAGQRVFDIAINGTAVQSHLDIFAAAGGANTAYDAIFPVTVSTGQVTITLTAVTGFPKINAIEIKQTSVTPDFTVAASPSSRSVTVGGNTTSYTITTTAVNGFSGTVSFTASGLPVGATASFSPTTVAGSGSTTMTVNTGSSTPVGTSSLSVTASSGTLSHAAGASLVVTSSSFTPIRVNAGGPAYTDSLAQLWSADTGYQQGGGNSTTASITGTSDPTLYQTEHYSTGSTLTYQFSVPNGTYTVNLKFAEIYYTSAGQRVFDVILNGITVRSHLDIFATAGGGNIALDLAYPVVVANGQVTITLGAVLGFAKINAIEIR